VNYAGIRDVTGHPFGASWRPLTASYFNSSLLGKLQLDLVFSYLVTLSSVLPRLISYQLVPLADLGVASCISRVNCPRFYLSGLCSTSPHLHPNITAVMQASRASSRAIRQLAASQQVRSLHMTGPAKTSSRVTSERPAVTPTKLEVRSQSSTLNSNCTTNQLLLT